VPNPLIVIERSTICSSHQTALSVVVPHLTSSLKGTTSSAMQELLPKSLGQCSYAAAMTSYIMPPLDPTTGSRLFLVEKHVELLLDSVLFVVSLGSYVGPIRILHASLDFFLDPSTSGGRFRVDAQAYFRLHFISQLYHQSSQPLSMIIEVQLSTPSGCVISSSRLVYRTFTPTRQESGQGKDPYSLVKPPRMPNPKVAFL